MISVEKSEASDKKTPTESESKESEEVSKPGELTAEEANILAPDYQRLITLLVKQSHQYPLKVVRNLWIQP